MIQTRRVPEYADHAPVFVSIAVLDGNSAEAHGGSKNKSEKEAARLLLDRLSIRPDYTLAEANGAITNRAGHIINSGSVDNPKSLLLQVGGKVINTRRLHESSDHSPLFVSEAVWGTSVVNGHGRSKKESEYKAAHLLL